MVFVFHIYVDNEYGHVFKLGTFMKECCLRHLEFIQPLPPDSWPFLITEFKTSSFCGAGLYWYILMHCIQM
jgi:hypothetical protein